MTLQPAAADSSPSRLLLPLLDQACAAAALRYSMVRAAKASRAAALAREVAEEAERGLAPRVRALLRVSPPSSSYPRSPSESLRVDLGSGVLARAVPVREKTAILPIGLGFYLESKGNGNAKDDNGDEGEALAAARIAALRDRAQRAADMASRARAEAEGDARAALAR